jgi:hypothetical protein
MTEEEKIYMSHTAKDGGLNKNNDIWKKAFAMYYPTLSMDIDWHYEKVLSKMFSNE